MYRDLKHLPRGGRDSSGVPVFVGVAPLVQQAVGLSPRPYTASPAGVQGAQPLHGQPARHWPRGLVAFLGQHAPGPRGSGRGRNHGSACPAPCSGSGRWPAAASWKSVWHLPRPPPAAAGRGGDQPASARSRLTVGAQASCRSASTALENVVPRFPRPETRAEYPRRDHLHAQRTRGPSRTAQSGRPARCFIMADNPFHACGGYCGARRSRHRMDIRATGRKRSCSPGDLRQIRLLFLHGKEGDSPNAAA